MLPQDQEKDHYLRKGIRLKKEIALLVGTQKDRFYSYLIYSIKFPFHLIEYVVFLILYSLFRDHIRSWIYAYQKRYFKGFFKQAGISPILVYPLPKTFDRPSIVFCVRMNHLISPFLLTLFKSKLHVPVQPILKRFPLSFLFRFFCMGRFVDSFGYADNDLKHNLLTISTLLQSDRAVVVNINKGYADPTSTDALHIYKEVIDFIQSDVDCYFISAPQLAYYNIGGTKCPNLVSVKFASQDTVFEGVDLFDETVVLEALVSFFRFKKCQLV